MLVMPTERNHKRIRINPGSLIEWLRIKKTGEKYLIKEKNLPLS